MKTTRRGRLVVTAVADDGARAALLALLARFRPELSQAASESLAHALPCTLLEDTPEVVAEGLVERLQGKNIQAHFEPRDGAANDFQTAAEPAETLLHRPDPRAVPARKSGRVALFSGLLALVLLGAFGVHYFRTAPRNVEETPLPTVGPLTCPAQGPSPSVLTVDPRQLQAAYACEYRLRPDRRLLAAFEQLPGLAVDLGLAKPGRYAAGEVAYAEDTWRRTLLDHGRMVVTADLGYQPDFETGLRGLAVWVAAMQLNPPKPEAGKKKTALERDALRRLDAGDPRGLLTALGQFEAQRLEDGVDADILAAAAMALAKLACMIEPDGLAVGDALTARSLALVALAKELDPERSTAREEAWLALAMGYRASADARLSSLGKASTDADKALAAYLRRDPDRLAAIDSRSAGQLAAWLHCRLLRELGLFDEAGRAAARLAKEQKSNYPALVEVIAAADPAEAERLSHLYQLQLMTDLAQKLRENDFSLTTLLAIRADLATPGGNSLSLTAFDGLLASWQPYGPAVAGGVLGNDALARSVMRGLYAGATALRFKAVFGKLGSLPGTEAFLSTLERDDAPMVVCMRAQLASRTGHLEDAEELAAGLLARPDLPVDKVDDVFALLPFSVRRFTLGPVAAARLDGRPAGVFEAARLHWRLNDADMARAAYARGLELDPYAYGAMDDLALLTRDDTALQAALTRQPDNLRLHMIAGRFYLYQASPAEPDKALACFDQTLRLAPGEPECIRGRAAALRRLGRLDEAEALLAPLVDGPKQAAGLELVLARIGLAKIRLDADRPEAAWEAIEPAIESMQADALVTAARAAERLGRDKLAGQQLDKAVQRYPDVPFVLSAALRRAWQTGNDERAGRLADLGRASQGKYQAWYRDDFLELFGDADEERILAAGRALVEQGAGAGEISNLAFGLAALGRPAQAVALNRLAPAQGGGQLLKAAEFATFIEDWKGSKEALDYLNRALSEEMLPAATALLYQVGSYALVLDILSDPDGLPRGQREFGWLQRLLAWLANDRMPAGLEPVFADHYRQAGDRYREAGRMLLGLCSEEDLLALARTPKAVCETAYYLGFAARLRGDIPKAVRWYRICLETGQSENGEYRWASDELYWWGKVGLAHRPRLPGQARERGTELASAAKSHGQ